MDCNRFEQACQAALNLKEKHGIGTLGEKSIHATLKYYFEPNDLFHEIPCDGYVADIRNESGFIEIQTRALYRLTEKLSTFLQQASVTVVYPIAAKSWLYWVGLDGTVEERRKIPRNPTAAAVLPELFRLKQFLPHPNLQIAVLLLEVEDYRLKDGTGPSGKKHATKFDRYPVRLLHEIWLRDPTDYRQLVPVELPEPFTAKEYAKAVKLPAAKASAAVSVLHMLGALNRVGKRKNAYLYCRDDQADTSVACLCAEQKGGITS